MLSFIRNLFSPSPPKPEIPYKEHAPKYPIPEIKQSCIHLHRFFKMYQGDRYWDEDNEAIPPCPWCGESFDPQCDPLQKLKARRVTQGDVDSTFTTSDYESYPPALGIYFLIYLYFFDKFAGATFFLPFPGRYLALIIGIPLLIFLLDFIIFYIDWIA